MNVSDLWALYSPVSRRDNDSHKTEQGRARHLIRHLGARGASQLSLSDVDAYRAARLEEKTYRGAPPAPATLDREVELLKRMLNYAVRCRKLYANPLGDVALLGKANVRRSNLKEPDFARLVDASPAWLRPLEVVAYDTGLRLGSILRLRWEQVDLVEGTITFEAGELKNEQPLKVYLTKRVHAVFSTIAAERKLDQRFVFVNLRTGDRYKDIRKSFKAAAKAIGRPELWFHDLRRSFATRARRRGIAEKVVMRMGGWKTDSAFRRYNIIEDEDVQNAAKALED